MKIELADDLKKELGEEVVADSRDNVAVASKEVTTADPLTETADSVPDDVGITDVIETGEQPVLEDALGNDEATDESDANEPDGSPDTFPKAYVDKLRKEAADNRVKAKRAEDYANRLHTALVEANGRLADPSDLPFDAAHLEDAEALDAAISDLLARKPHLASRTPRGNIGQGVNVPEQDDFSLSSWLRGA